MDVDMPEYITFLGGGSETSTYTLAAKAMQFACKEYFPDIITRVELSAGPKSQQRVEEYTDTDKVVLWAMTGTKDFYWHKEGVGRYKDVGPFKNVRMLEELYPPVALVAVVLASSDITDVSQLKDKRISLGSTAGGTWTGVEPPLKAAYGFDYKDIEAAGGMVYTDSWTEESEMLAAGDIDCWMGNLVQPYSGIVKVSMSKDIRLLTFSEEFIKAGTETPGYARVTIPAGSFKGQTEDYKTIGSALPHFTHKDTPDDVAYNLCAMWFTKGMEKAKEMKASAYDRPFAEYSVEMFNGPDPLGLNEAFHPGAAKYHEDLTAALKK
jgi:TRAP transporter TAXI family solute receptor